jgi:hypothetical protein
MKPRFSVLYLIFYSQNKTGHEDAEARRKIISKLSSLVSWRLSGRVLFAYTELVDDLTVTVQIVFLQIFQMATTLADHFQEASP